jgi:polyisoprenoid-binding protein YceI
MNDTQSSLPNWRGAVSVLALAAALVGGAWMMTTPYQLTPDSVLHIDGTSNVHDWTCDVPTVDGTFDVAVAGDSSAAALPGFDEGTVQVPVQAIDCGRDGMTENLREAMKAEDHPKIRYRLQSAEVKAHPDSSGNWFQVQSTGELAVAGSTRTVDITAAGRRLDDGRVRIAGEKALKMTHFGIEPPSAMFGALQTGDEVTVRFDVKAQSAE